MALRARGTRAALKHSAAIPRRVLPDYQSCQRAHLQGLHQARASRSHSPRGVGYQPACMAVPLSIFPSRTQLVKGNLRKNRNKAASCRRACRSARLGHPNALPEVRVIRQNGWSTMDLQKAFCHHTDVGTEAVRTLRQNPVVCGTA